MILSGRRVFLLILEFVKAIVLVQVFGVREKVLPFFSDMCTLLQVHTLYSWTH